MNPPILPPVLGKIVRQTMLINIPMATRRGKGTFQIQTSCKTEKVLDMPGYSKTIYTDECHQKNNKKKNQLKLHDGTCERSWKITFNR